MKISIPGILFFVCFIIISSNCQNKDQEGVFEVWDNEPDVVSFSADGIPSDAIILFDGTSWDQWVHQNSKKPVKWTVSNGVGTVVPKSGYIQTKESFGDCQLHLEWKAPEDTTGLKSQARGNSGVFLQTHYEVQILDSYRNETYHNGQAGSIYKQHIPLVNATKPPSQWQVYDIIYTAPQFHKDKSLKSPAYFTVFHNGILIQNHVTVHGKTLNMGIPTYSAHGELPISLQDHNNEMQFRNIWVRRL